MFPALSWDLRSWIACILHGSRTAVVVRIADCAYFAWFPHVFGSADCGLRVFCMVPTLPWYFRIGIACILHGSRTSWVVQIADGTYFAWFPHVFGRSDSGLRYFAWFPRFLGI